MPLELDHVFIMCDVDAPEATALTTVGLVEGPPNVHPGQGTACRRFAFPRQYLELLWVADAADAQDQHTRRTRLWERWSLRRRGACPFGLVFRIAGGTTTVPFPTWSYEPRYLPVGVSLERLRTRRSARRNSSSCRQARDAPTDRSNRQSQASPSRMCTSARRVESWMVRQAVGPHPPG